MGIKKDWMERQIDAIASTFAAILFGKDKVKTILDVEDEEDSSTQLEDDILERMAKKLIVDKDFNRAEKLIFDAMDKQKTARRFELALNFFNEAHEFSDDILGKYGYSREKIENGIEKLKSLYNEN